MASSFALVPIALRPRISPGLLIPIAIVFAQHRAFVLAPVALNGTNERAHTLLSKRTLPSGIRPECIATTDIII